ncbi:HD domain-containing protein [Desulfoprunum benzoelyticum]|uniref:Poly(A) polymerase n=1 Tax=Desulfoprunum benzoelyticum TaxID=1506996 RepID=A0A840UW40_9BACT|nr:HD domain-containing protein [Desulfoprunum benzoelyticum]MBB5347624.1 poly(A) polymerase [Desulfoprunum benzoelyticum]MBM9529247.1 HD domain-containing protein [Desulfoprunum benzoelyticum]
MQKERTAYRQVLTDLLDPWPPEIGHALRRLDAEIGGIYLSGGTVRDRLLGRAAGDLDLTVARDAAGCCRALIGLLGGGAFVELGRSGEDVARVVWRGLTVDFAGFRGRAETIAEDLCRRDYTVNAMAVPFDSLGGGKEAELIDPLHGCDDLRQGILRACPGAYDDDPLRMLRGFRFMASLDFAFDAASLAEIGRCADLIARPAVERISYELGLIMDSPRACPTFRAMDGAGLLRHIAPELYAGVGVEQPEFHHLDVFHHSFAAFEQMEAIIAQPGRHYPQAAGRLDAYLAAGPSRRCLKWAALCHDIGKPAAQAVAFENGRITFHNHDEIGRRIFRLFAERLKWSKEERERTGQLIAMHMHPFHLCNVRRSEPLSKRAVLKLSQRAGADLDGLFLLAMADSLASRGEKKPPRMEAELVELFGQVLQIIAEDIRPVAVGPPLLTGDDLITELGLSPGPIFRTILQELEALRVEGRITAREEAIAWVTAFIADGAGDGAELP